MKTEVVNLRVTEELKAKLKRDADRLGMSMSTYICYLISKEGK